MNVQPFIKWAGGKRKLAPLILSRLSTINGRYIEPFLGGGAIALSLDKNIEKVLSDRNGELINAYQVIQNLGIKELTERLDYLKNMHDEEFYYIERGQEYTDKTLMAARFIYLNKAGFNGLYRVNRQGKFNVSSGKKEREKLSLYDKNNLEKLQIFLQNCTIIHRDWSDVEASSGDTVYFDPPYHGTFNSYSDKPFIDEDHIKLRDKALELINKDVHVVLSNNNDEFVHELYKDFNIEIIDVRRNINRDGKNRTGKEVLITSK